jgi:hypothetical protein
MSDFARLSTGRVSRRSFLLASAGLAVPAIVRADPVDPITPAGPDLPIPDTAAGRQLAWVLEQVNRSARGLTLREIREHVDPAFLAMLPADQIRAVLKTYVGPNGPLVPARFEGGVSETRAYVIALNPARQMWRIRLSVSPAEPFLITQLYFEPVSVPFGPATPVRSWSELTAGIGRLAPRTSFAAAELTEAGPIWFGRLYGDKQRAIASAFKLYVLGELVRQVASGEAAWQESLAVQDSLRSLPNGDMRLLPAGYELPVQYFAERMIAGSDNTATDHLIGRLGRPRVQAGFADQGHSRPEQNQPLLMTREWFAIRMRLRDTQIERYLAADAGKRLRILADTVDPLAAQLSETEPWPGPRFLDRIEWFAGAADLVRAQHWLWQNSDGPDGAPVRDALSLNCGACWHPDTWRYIGYKGGYETGAMSNTWLLQRQDGRWFSFAAIINDTRREIDANGLWLLQTAAERLLAATR